MNEISLIYLCISLGLILADILPRIGPNKYKPGQLDSLSTYNLIQTRSPPIQLPYPMPLAFPSSSLLTSSAQIADNSRKHGGDPYEKSKEELAQENGAMGLFLYPSTPRGGLSSNTKVSHYDENGFYHKIDVDEGDTPPKPDEPSLPELLAAYGPFDKTMSPQELAMARNLWPYRMPWKVPSSMHGQGELPTNSAHLFRTNIVGERIGAMPDTRRDLAQYLNPSPPLPSNSGNAQKFPDFDPYHISRQAAHGGNSFIPQKLTNE